MTTTMTKATLDQSGLDLLSNLGPEWLKTARREGFASYQSLAFPTGKDEAWRRTDPERVRPESHQVAPPVSTFGQLGEATREGVTFCSLEEAVKTQSGLVEKHLHHVGRLDEHSFSALNRAFWSGGSFFHIAKEKSTGEGAVTAHHHFSAGDTAAAIPHSLVLAERHSKASVIETFEADDEALLAAPMVEIHLEEGANLRYVFVHKWGDRASVVPTIHATLAKDATLQLLFVGLGGRLAKVFIESDLCGQGSKSEVLGLVLAEGRQHYDLDIVQNHRVGDTVSDVLCHIALTGKARSVFSGNVLCEPGAQKIDGYQQNRNLILSDKARADSMPKLEIEANDVRCTHGATFTTYDRDQKFYLQSRGMTSFEAERLLVTGFFQEVIERTGQECVVEHLAELLARRMEKVLG